MKKQENILGERGAYTMNNEIMKEIKKDMNSCASFFYFSENKNIVDFQGNSSKLLSILLPGIYKSLEHTNVTSKDFAELLIAYDKMKNEDE